MNPPILRVGLRALVTTIKETGGRERGRSTGMGTADIQLIVGLAGDIVTTVVWP